MRVRFGILGTASIARALINQSLEHAELVAVASRDIARAHAFADNARIPKRYGSYESLLGDPQIDAVYIPLPQHLHCEWTIQAAEAKKHVIVEKPLAVTVAEVEQMAAACRENSVLLMEALMYRFRRVHNRAREIVLDGGIGTLRYVNFAWSHNLLDRTAGSFRLDKNRGGGCLLDLGVYGLDWIRFMTGADPRLLHAYIRTNETGLDLFAHATFDSAGTLALMTCGYTTDANYYYLGGEKGSIFAPVSLSGRVMPSVLHIHLLGSDRRYTEEFPAENAYVAELEYFAQCIKENSPSFLDAANARKNIALIEAIRRSAIHST